MSDNKKVHIVGGGTVYHVRPHLALCAPAYGTTARRLTELCEERFQTMDVMLHLTRMAGGSKLETGSVLETNDDVASLLQGFVSDDTTKIIFMNAALCDYEGSVDERSGKKAERLKTSDGNQILKLKPAAKIISSVRKTRKDIFLVGFKTTASATEDEQYIAGLHLLKGSSCNLVLANDLHNRRNMIITPEEARYHVTTDRDEALRNLVDMTWHRSHLTFTQSTVVDGTPVPWSDERVPTSLRTVVDYCRNGGAYKTFRGATVGHFAVKVDDNLFLTSIRKTDFNQLDQTGLVLVKTDGPDTVVAYGAKPSVGGQSQRIVFNDHPGMDCIVHFHCELRKDHTEEIPTRSQREVECGSHACGNQTSKGLQEFGNLKAVFLENHGPNIVFNRKIDPQEVITFIERNFDLSSKTGGFVSRTV